MCADGKRGWHSLDLLRWSVKSTGVAFDRLTRGSPSLSRWRVHHAIASLLSFMLVIALAQPAWAEAESVHPEEQNLAIPRNAPSEAPEAEGLGEELATEVVEEPSAPEITAKVRLRERHVFSIHLPYAGKEPDVRARSASQALERVLDVLETSEPRIEQMGDVAVVFVGTVPIVQLTEADARAAGDSSLSVHAASVSAKVRDALQTERKRSALAKGVFSFSLLVFSGLIAILLLRKISQLGERARAWIEQHPERVPGLRVQELEVVRPRAARGALSIALTIGRTLAQLMIGYGWLVFALSLFATTRPYTDRLTALVLGPLSELVGRIGSALPLLVVTIIAAVAVGVLLRFLGVFFAGVERGDMQLAWLPKELAEPTSWLVRVGVIVGALVVGAPLVTGSDQGFFARSGLIALIAFGLACTPLLATVAAGIPVVFGRRFLVGDFIQIGPRLGRVTELTLFDVRLEDEHGSEVRIPHLLGLVQVTRVLGRSLIATVWVSIDPEIEQAEVREVLTEAARTCGSRPKAELVSINAEGANWRVSASLDAKTSPAELAVAISDALSRERIALGRRAPEREAG